MFDHRGIVLIVVLLIVLLLVAAVTGFVYDVYTFNSLTENWKTLQSLRILAESTSEAATVQIQSMVSLLPYTYTASMTLPVPVSEYQNVSLRIEDEQARVNINRLIYPNGLDNRRIYSFLQRLCRIINVDPTVVDRFADWIDRDTIERIPGSEDGAKNGPFFSIEELGFVKGVKKEEIQRLLPYITVYYDRTGFTERININTAPREVLLALHPEMTESMVEEIILYRQQTPFQSIDDIKKVYGVQELYPQLAPLITVKSYVYRLTTIAEENELKSVLQQIISFYTSRARVLFYRLI